MKFMIIVHPGDKKEYEAGKMPPMEEMKAMGKFNEELVNAGVMQAGEGLHPSSKAVRIHFPGQGKNPSVTNGPFADSLIGGYWLWQVKSKEEALNWAKKAPMEDGATLEIRQVFEAADFGPEMEQYEKKLQQKMEAQKR